MEWIKTNGKNLIGFVVIDDNFADQFCTELPEGHFVKTHMRTEKEKNLKDTEFDTRYEGLTEGLAQKAFKCMMKPFSAR